MPEGDPISIDISPEDCEEMVLDYVDRKIREHNRARAKRHQ
jgi:hypothetical protein